MKCDGCGFENPTGLPYCGNCGRSLGSGCPSCGFENPAGFRFCGRCSAPLSPRRAAPDPRAYTPKHLAEKILTARSALEGERKQVTVLFADVKGSMELADELDPEEWHGILDRFFQTLADGIHRFEGTINQYTGDGVMALFGAPIAHEDHARRACYAALHLQDELRRYAEELKRTRGLSFAVRMGLNSGEVVVGKIGDNLRMDYTAQGHTVGLAARTESLAEAGKVYLAQATAALVSGYFRLEDLGAFIVKGVHEPVRVFELQGVGALRTPLERSRARGFSRFVGRVDEMTALKAALGRALEGSGQVVGVVADPGLGKSRLCFEFTERCRARGITVYVAHGVSHGKLIPFLPVLELFRAFFRISEEDMDEAAREKIAGRMLLLDESLGDSLPLFFDFLGVPDPERPLAPMDPEARQRQLHATVKRVVQARSRREPAVVLLEDLHWFDGGSEGVLEVLVDAAGATRTLLVLNFRPEYHARWMQKSYYQQLPLVPLGPAAIEELLRDLLGSDPSLGKLPARIRERTGGNPFFIEETVQELAETESLEGAKGAYRLARSAASLALPATVHAVLAARIDRLGEREKHVLQTAAVIGRLFAEPVLRRVAGLADDGLAAALHKLADAEFVYEEALYPELQYVFKHALTQEVAYHSVLVERRKTLHERTAQAIETLCHDSLESHYGELAHHYKLSGNIAKAIEYLHLAGEQAGERSANAEAASHLTAALGLLQKLPETRERDRRELSIQATLGAVLTAIKGWAAPEKGRALERARDLCRRLEETRQLGPVLSNLFQFYVMQGRLQAADALAEESLRLAESLQDSGFLLSAHHSSGEVCHWTGRVARAQAHFERAIALYDSEQHRTIAWVGADPWMISSGLLSWSEQWSGKSDRAIARSRAAINRAREEPDRPYELALALMMAAGVHQFRRDERPTRELAEAAVSLFSEQGSPDMLGMSLWLKGWALCELGQQKEGIEEIARGIASYRSCGTSLGLSWALGLFACAHAKIGEIDKAFDVLNEAFEVVEQNGERFYEAELLRLRGELLLKRAAPDDEAEACFRDAIAIARRQEAKTWELRTATSLGSLLRKLGRKEEARRTVGETLAWFTEGFDAPDLRDAKALLEDL
ncbi:MAG: adenylate/guanylate cyclase domain-containing protein [Candidatus Binatia bacterium]